MPKKKLPHDNDDQPQLPLSNGHSAPAVPEEPKAEASIIADAEASEEAAFFAPSNAKIFAFHGEPRNGADRLKGEP